MRYNSFLLIKIVSITTMFGVVVLAGVLFLNFGLSPEKKPDDLANAAYPNDEGSMILDLDNLFASDQGYLELTEEELEELGLTGAFAGEGGENTGDGSFLFASSGWNSNFSGTGGGSLFRYNPSRAGRRAQYDEFRGPGYEPPGAPGIIFTPQTVSAPASGGQTTYYLIPVPSGSETPGDGGGTAGPDTAVVPVPAAAWLLGTGLVGLLGLRRRIRR